MSWGHSFPSGRNHRLPGETKQAHDSSVPGEQAVLPAKRSPLSFLAAYLDRVGGLSDSASGLQAQFAAGTSSRLQTALQALDPASLKKIRSHFSDGEWGEILSLSQEKDFAYFLGSWIQFGGRLKNAEKLGQAELAFRQVESWGSEVPDGILQAARAESEVLQGGGSFGRRAEFLGPRLVKEAADPWMLAGFGVAGTVYQGTRLAALSRLAANPSFGFFSRGVGLRAAAAALGLAAEAPAFVATAKLGRGLSGAEQGWSADAWRKEILGTGLTLFFLKGAGALSQKASRGLPAWAPLVSNAGMAAGIYTAHLAEEALGFRAATGAARRLQDSLLTLFQFHVGGRLADGVFGGNLGRLQREWTLQGLRPPKGRPPAWTWLPAGAQPAPAGPRPGDAGKSFGPEISLMENSNDGGSGPKKPRLVSIRSGGETPPSVEVPAAPQPTVESLAREFARVSASADQAKERILIGLSELEMQLTSFLGHIVLERGKIPDTAKLGLSARARMDAVEAEFRHLPELQKRMEGLAFSVRNDPAAEQALADHRSWMLLLDVKHAPLLQILETLRGLVATQDPRRLQSRLFILSHFNAIFQEGLVPSPATEGQPILEEIFPHRAEGILRAPLVKHALRAGPPRTGEESRELPDLDFESPFKAEHEWAARLLYDLTETPPDTDIHSLLFKSEGIPGTTMVRQVLGYSGSSSEPYRGWLSVYLPVLSAAYRGNVPRLMRRLAPLTPAMNEDMRAATELGAWWLGQALRGKGQPASWPAEFLLSGADTAAKVALSEVLDWIGEPVGGNALSAWETQGPLGAAKLALHNFLQFPFDRDLPVLLTLQGPAGIREEALSFVTALLGAFHGDGFFNAEFLEHLASREYPVGERDIERRLKMDSLTSIAARMDETQADWNRLWDNVSRRDSQPPLLLQVAGDATARARVEFNNAFDEGRQYAITAASAFFKVLRKGTREGYAAEEISALHGQLEHYLRDIESAVDRMQRQPLMSANPANATPFQMIEQLKGALVGLRTIERALERLRQSGASGRFTVEESQVLFEQTAQLAVTFGLPHGNFANFWYPQPFEINEIRRLLEAMDPVGHSLPPTVKAPLFDKRNDWATVKAVTQAYWEAAKLVPGTQPNLENLLEIYFETVGARVVRIPNRSLVKQISPSALFSVIMPAYLWLHSQNPEAAYRELKDVMVTGGDRNREAWRGTVFLALRLLEGATLDVDLIAEAGEFFRDTPFGTRMKELASLVDAKESRRTAQMEAWGFANNILDAVALGAAAALLNPAIPEKAREAAMRHVDRDPDGIAARVAGALAEYSPPKSLRAKSLQSTLPPAGAEPESRRDARVSIGNLRAHYATIQTFLPEALRTLAGLYQSALSEPLLGYSARLQATLKQVRAQLEMVERDISILKDSKINFLNEGEYYSKALDVLLVVVENFQKELREKGMTPDFAQKIKTRLKNAAGFLDPKNRSGLVDLVNRLAESNFVRPHPMTARLDQVEGAVLGAAVADAFAAPFEFMTPEQIREKNWNFKGYLAKGNWPAGKWTDDTLFALATMDSILDDEAIVPRRMAHRFSEMGVHRKERGFGLATKRAVRRLEKGADWKSSGHEDAASNGAAMRVAPVAIFSYRDLETLKRNVILSSQITHAGYESILGALGYAYVLATILRGEFKHETILKKTRTFIGPGRFTNSLSDVEKYLKDKAADPAAVIQKIGTSGLIWESGAAGLYAFLKFLGDYEKTMVTLAQAGGDADTMATLAGSLAGAYGGVGNIPEHWAEGVEDSPAIRARAQRLFDLIHPKKTPKPAD